MEQGKKKIIIFDNHLNAGEVIKIARSKDVLVIPFSAKCRLALKKNGIVSAFPHELLGLPDMNRIGAENIARVKKICDYLDCKAAYFRIKVFFDTLYTTYFILDKLLDFLHPAEVVVFKSGSSVEDLVEGDDSICSEIMEKVLKHKHRDIILSVFMSKGSPNLLSRFIGKAHHLKQLLVRGLSYIIGGRRNYIVLHNSHDIPYLIRILNGMGMRAIGLNSEEFALSRQPKVPDSLSNPIKELFAKARSDKEYRLIFDSDEPLFSFANACLETYITKGMTIFGPADRIRNRLSALKPLFLVTSDCRCGPGDAILLETARSLKIPVVTYQEGGGAGYLDWPLFNIDMELSNYFLAYGPGVKESAYMHGEAKIVPVGSLRLDSVRRLMRNETCKERTICVVLDNIKTGLYQHYPHNGGFFSEAYTLQLRILEALKPFKDMRFIIKTVKGREYLYKDFDGGRFRIETRPLEDIAHGSDAFLIDSPSTVLQECMLSEKPIVLFHSQADIKFEPDALVLLEKRARVVSREDELAAAVRSLIEDVKSGNAMTRNKEFTNRYCVMEKTGKNVEQFFGTLTKEGAA